MKGRAIFMIRSMTGYGAAKAALEELSLSVELKSVNNRYLDISIRIPRNYIFVEDAMKSVIQRHITRGKVDVFVNIDSTKAHDMQITVNESLAEEFIAALEKIAATYHLKNDLTALAVSRFPDVLQMEKKELDREAMSRSICDILENALQEFNQMRIREGEKMRESICLQMEEITNLLHQIEERSPESVTKYKERLEQRMREILSGGEYDESRLLTEVAIFADKVAVNEETVRIHSHLAQLQDLLSGDSPVGRKLDFLLQELNREVNTIGSKCNDADMTRYVVALKAELEKIREQVQNIE